MSRSKVAKAKDCGCIDKLQAELRLMGVRVARSFMVNTATGEAGMSGARIAIEKLDSKSRKSLPAIFCAYCPVCGKKCP